MDPQTEELRAAHDVLAEVYAVRLAGLLEQTPADRAVLDLFAELVRRSGSDSQVADIGCGTGRLTPYLTARRLSPRGVDLSPEMVGPLDATSLASSSRSPTCGRCRSTTPASTEQWRGTR